MPRRAKLVDARFVVVVTRAQKMELGSRNGSIVRSKPLQTPLDPRPLTMLIQFVQDDNQAQKYPNGLRHGHELYISDENYEQSHSIPRKSKKSLKCPWCL